VHKETLSVAAMCVSNPDYSFLGINGRRRDSERSRGLLALTNFQIDRAAFV
jgi:hypothetical protein